MWERALRRVQIALLLAFVLPILFFLSVAVVLNIQKRTIGVDFARVGERYDAATIPVDWKVVKTYPLTLKGKSLRLYHYEEPVVMIPEEHGVIVDSHGLITEIIRGDDDLHRRLQEWEEQGVLKR